MLNRSASLAMSTSILKALPDKLDIKRHKLRILYLSCSFFSCTPVNGRFLLGFLEIILSCYALSFLANQ